jgi:hypothetical protein
LWLIVGGIGPGVAIVIGFVVLPLDSSGCADNVIGCATSVAIHPDDKRLGSSSALIANSTHLQVTFQNTPSGAGVALVLAHPLDVRGYRGVELEGTLTEEFIFALEYKSGSDSPVTSTASRTFPRTLAQHVERVPIEWDGTITQIALNFTESGEHSRLELTDVRLVK